MRVLTDTLRQIELAVRMDGASRYLLSLRRGLERVFSDGYAAHRANANITQEQEDRLKDCETCSRGGQTMGAGPLCVDNDAWKALGDVFDFGGIKPSVDLLLFAEDAGVEQVVMVEAKLGGATRRRGDAPHRPSQVEICEKYDWSVKRVNGRLKVCKTIWLLVSLNTLQKMRQKVSRWNRSDASHSIKCVCCADFLKSFGALTSDSSVAVRCQGSAARIGG